MLHCGTWDLTILLSAPRGTRPACLPTYHTLQNTTYLLDLHIASTAKPRHTDAAPWIQ